MEPSSLLNHIIDIRSIIKHELSKPMYVTSGGIYRHFPSANQIETYKNVTYN